MHLPELEALTALAEYSQQPGQPVMTYCFSAILKAAGKDACA